MLQWNHKIDKHSLFVESSLLTLFTISTEALQPRRLFRAGARTRRRVAVVIVLLGGIYLFHIQMSNKTQTHLQGRPQFADNSLDFVLHGVADEHIFYVIAVKLIKENINVNVS